MNVPGSKLRLIVAITGASGTMYGVRKLENFGAFRVQADAGRATALRTDVACS